MTRHDEEAAFLREVLPRFGLRWEGFRRVQGQVHKRIARRVKALGFKDLGSYRGHLAEHPEEWLVLDGLCRATISRFYRDRAVFDWLREQGLPRLLSRAREHRRPLRCFSAGCASGEEPLTLSLVLRLGLGMHSGYQIVASDADAALLERARNARYQGGSLKELPAGWKERAFVREGSLFRLRPELGQNIEWRCEDLRRSMPPGPFDLILCRNLAFTYFAPPLQQAALARLAEQMEAAGVLALGAHELLPATDAWRRVGALPIWALVGSEGQESSPLARDQR